MCFGFYGENEYLKRKRLEGLMVKTYLVCSVPLVSTEIIELVWMIALIIGGA